MVALASGVDDKDARAADRAAALHGSEGSHAGTGLAAACSTSARLVADSVELRANSSTVPPPIIAAILAARDDDDDRPLGPSAASHSPSLSPPPMATLTRAPARNSTATTRSAASPARISGYTIIGVRCESTALTSAPKCSSVSINASDFCDRVHQKQSAREAGY